MVANQKPAASPAAAPAAKTGCCGGTNPNCPTCGRGQSASTGNISEAQGFLSTVTEKSKDDIAKAMVNAIMSEKGGSKKANDELAHAIENAHTIQK